MSEGSLKIYNPIFQSEMHWHRYDGVSVLSIKSTQPVPNAWYRFWARVLLDVTWEKIDD